MQKNIYEHTFYDHTAIMDSLDSRAPYTYSDLSVRRCLATTTHVSVSR